MQIPLGNDEIVFLRGQTGTVAMVKTRGDFYYLDSTAEELVLFTEEDDLIVASAFGVGQEIDQGLRCTLFQIRELKAPLIVLPKGHKASLRLKTVVSLGSRTRLSCKIQPGTHPEQDVLCGSEEFEGMEILAVPGGASLKGFNGEVTIQKLWGGRTK
jgi:hypothetical protein